MSYKTRHLAVVAILQLDLYVSPLSAPPSLYIRTPSSPRSQNFEMANTFCRFAILILLSVTALCSLQVSALGGMVGGRTKIKDVKTNKEVQELGRYCVEEYNRKQRQQHDGIGSGNAAGGRLTFSQVVEAEKQVVSGIKYYLKISAASPRGVPKTFDAVLVVKPWEKSRELLNFSPSPATK